MSEDGHTQVDLVVNAQHHAGDQVVEDVLPVKVVPETLGQPVQADLQLADRKHNSFLKFSFLNWE